MNVKFDEYVLIAESNGNKLNVVRWGSVWLFQLQYVGQEAFQTGASYATKTDILRSAYCMALSSLCGCFKHEDIKIDSRLINSVVHLTTPERIAINTAIRILSGSDSDHADQAIHHLKKIAKRM